jgi:hypothetical protein
MREKYVYFNSGAYATASITPNTDAITIAAVDKTSKGNLISVHIRHDDAAGTVTVTGNAIVVGVGGGNDKDATDIVGYINGDADASALVTASGADSGNNHAAADYDSTVTYLSGGEAGVSYPLSSFAGMHPTDNDTFVMYFKSMRNFDGTTSGANEEVVSDKIIVNLIGNDTDGTSIRQAMDAIVKGFTSSRSRMFDIVVGDDREDSTDYLFKPYNETSSLGSITVYSGNS